MLMPMVPITHMGMVVGNGFVHVGMGMPVGAICCPVFRLTIWVLMDMVCVLTVWCVQVFVFVPHLVMAMPVGMVFIEQQGNAANHQDTSCNQIGAECFVEDEYGETRSNKGCRRKNHRFPRCSQLSQCQQV